MFVLYSQKGSKIETIEELSENEDFNFTSDDLERIRRILQETSLKKMPKAKGKELDRKNSSTTSGTI